MIKSYWLRCASSAITMIFRRSDKSGGWFSLREDDAAGTGMEPFTQIVTALNQIREVAEKFMATGEGSVKLAEHQW